ncbi:MAG: indole-3-glycerol phosphate synthase TrpC [Acidobacteria bacterium]|nr:indole-3-glycerol phosphate synthase TrpC [Acidobacteriota bacterium]
MLDRVADYRLPDALAGTFLEKIMRSRIHEIVGAKRNWPAEAIRASLERFPEPRSLRKALLRRSPAIIAEIKKASPSGGTLRHEFDPVNLGREFERGGAAALSVLTEVKYFQGGLENLAVLRWNTTLPLLRKDFIVDPYQILEARHAGSDAVLLVASLLDDESLKDLVVEARSLGMEAVVEVHTSGELDRALRAGAGIIGVNNRDLRTLDVSLEVSMQLAGGIPQDVVAISESGIRTPDDLRRLTDAGYRAFLIGEQLMRARSPRKALEDLILGGTAGRRRIG